MLSAPSGGHHGQRHKIFGSLKCLALPMSNRGTGHFIEFDDPLQLKWRSSSLRAKEILHRQQGNHKEITVPAAFIVSLIYTNQGGKEL